MTRFRAAFAAAFFLTASCSAEAAQGEPVFTEHVRASLVTAVDAARPGETVDAGLWMEIERGWHVYWTNPGEAGLPTRIRWRLPEGWSADNAEWPLPARFTSGGVIGFGYAERVLVPARIRIPASAVPGVVTLRAEVSWLACESVCVPGSAVLEVPLQISAAAPPAGKTGARAWPSRLSAARRRVPAPLPDDWTAEVFAYPDKTLRLKIRPPRNIRDYKPADFFPEDSESIELSAPAVTVTEEGVELALRRSVLSESVPERLAGILAPEGGSGRPIWRVDLPVVVGEAPEAL